MQLPKNERTFPFNEKGDLYGHKYEGTFTVKCVLNMFEKRMLEIEKSRLRTDIANPTPDLIALTTIQANLSVRIIDAPEWWKQSENGNNIQDENIIITLFDKVVEQEEEWRKELKDLAEESTEGNLK